MIRRDVPPALRSRSFRSDRIAWVVFAVVVLVAALGTRAWLHRRVRVEGPPAAQASTAFRLSVLAWDRIGQRSSDAHLEERRLAEQLDALRAAGFAPVSLRQVRDAYRGGAPLPERAVLLTFDGGHRSTYEAVDPLLRRLKWPAVMFLDPRLQENRDATYVYWDRVQRMIDSGLWDVGTIGDGAQKAGVVSRRLGGYAVLASVSTADAQPEPGGNGVGPPLGFENSLFGVNDASAAPRRLFRIRVPREWSGQDLVERLALSLAAPGAPTCGDAAPVPAARWVSGTGRLETGADGVTLSGAPRAEAWLAGGEWARDFVLEAEVRPERGAFWIVQQAIGSRDQWRWGGTERTLYLQRLRPGTPVEVVSQVELPASRGAWHTLRLVKRGEGVWVEWDGAPVPDMPRSVAAHRRGYVGFATGSPKEAGRVAVRNARFAAIPYRVRAVSASPAPDEVDELLRDAPCLAAISPPGLVERGGHELGRRAADGRLLAMLAARGAWELVPALEVSREPSAAPGRADEVAKVAEHEGWAGVRLVRRRGGAAAGRQTWPAIAAAWQGALGRHDLRVILDEGDEGEGR